MGRAARFVIVLDTHALIWLSDDQKLIGAATRKLVSRAQANDELAVSAFSFWETAMLITKRRLAIVGGATDFRRKADQRLLD